MDFFSPHAYNAKRLLALNWQHWNSEIESVAEDSINFWRTGRVIGKRASKSVMYQWLLCNTKRHVAVTGQGYGRFHFIEAPLTCVTFMTCYITFKLPFIPAFFGEHVCFSTPPPPLSLSAGLFWQWFRFNLCKESVFCALTFTGLITFFLEPNIFVIILFDNFID